MCIAVAGIIGGDMWALPAIVLPICAGWVAIQAWMARGAGDSATSDRAPGDPKGGARRPMPFGILVVAGVIWFMVVVGWIADLL